MDEADVGGRGEYGDLIRRQAKLEDKIIMLEESVLSIQQHIHNCKVEFTELNRLIGDLDQVSRAEAKEDTSTPVSPTCSNTGPLSATARSPLPTPDSLVPTTVPVERQTFSRPGLKNKKNFIAKEPIKPADHVAGKQGSESLMLHKDLSAVVRLDDGWNEIWCHICGANSSLNNLVRGVYGLFNHIRFSHKAAAEALLLRHVPDICGRHLLTREEVSALCQWKVTVNIRTPDQGALQVSARNDISDFLLVNDDVQETTVTSGYIGHLIDGEICLQHGDEDDWTPCSDFIQPSPANSVVSIGANRYSLRPSLNKRPAYADMSELIDDEDTEGVAKRVKKRRTNAPRHTYSDDWRYEHEGESLA